MNPRKQSLAQRMEALAGDLDTLTCLMDDEDLVDHLAAFRRELLSMREQLERDYLYFRVADDDHDARWKLHAAACSMKDYTFWIERVEGNKWQACEVETGATAAPAATPREAMENYWERRWKTFAPPH